MACFETDSGIPFSDVNLFTRKAHSPKWSPDSSTSEVSTIQLEFRDLSRATGDPKYEVSKNLVTHFLQIQIINFFFYWQYFSFLRMLFHGCLNLFITWKKLMV